MNKNPIRRKITKTVTTKQQNWKKNKTNKAYNNNNKNRMTKYEYNYEWK